MESIFIILTGIIAVVATFYISTHLKQGAVRASAGLSLLVALIPFLFPDLFTAHLASDIPNVFFGASFIGMVSKNLISNYWLLALSGLLFSLIYLHSGSLFNGFGGALGTTASISVVVILGFKKLKEKITNEYSQGI